ncbi:MAG: peptide chain release factor N(5)-glutamine methyltransferase, partial [Nevskiales bacterium]|nr:peptide chain release factor N(5)-glutamine methyltransferase [Nevskiales bacterium]
AGEKREAGGDTIAWLDRDVLLAHVLGCDRSTLFTRNCADLTPQQRNHFDNLTARRAAGEPVAYLTGRKEFWSLTLTVTPDVLIPRPETELLVEWALELAGRREAGDGRRNVVDLGTGCGAIALALAKERPTMRVVGTDLSATALAVAKENARRHAVANVEFAQGSWFTPPASRLPPPDLVVSNPPYVAENDPHLKDLRFEPPLALSAGPDGLSALREIIHGAPRFLRSGGHLLLEHGAAQGSCVRDLLGKAGFDAVHTRRDLAGLERVTGGQWV